MARFEIRAALPEDRDAIYALAHHLDSVNLPEDMARIEKILERSRKSFTGEIKDPKRREYVFALVDHEAKRIIGTSMIIAQLGRKDAPYIYLDVIDEERYSATLDRHFMHKVLAIGYSYNGPTEIGGLILHPDYRRVPERLGQFLSYVRFLYLKMHRVDMQNEVLAELLPPLEPDGTSHLWNALGRHFTGLTYKEADKLSNENKEFIRGLFPEGTIYASLMPQDAQDVIGKVGAQTRGVEKLLRRIGFRYAERVDPFDGGPHFTAPTDEITLVVRSHRATLDNTLSADEAAPLHGRYVVGYELPEAPYFRAVLAKYTERVVERKTLRDLAASGDSPLPLPKGSLEEDVRAQLGIPLGESLWVLPLD